MSHAEKYTPEQPHLHDAAGATLTSPATKGDHERVIPEMRHPHPHIDPRQPRHRSQPATNPPVFAWKPLENNSRYSLMIARDPNFEEIYLHVRDLTEPLFLPIQAFPPGRFFWKWQGGTRESSVFSFEVTQQAVKLEIPPVEDWLQRFSPKHPRIFIRPEQQAQLKAIFRDERAAAWQNLQQTADKLLNESHEYPEPPFLPDRQADYANWFAQWYQIMWTSRYFVKGAETLGLAYLVSGDHRYARAACQRLASVSQWDPAGSSCIPHNDEAHMSVIWHGAQACDFVWDEFTANERARVIAQYRQRGKLTFEHMHDLGSYGVTRFDSHAGREIVFLALIALVFHEEIPEAKIWLEWLRPVLCGIWPVWAGDDGAWAEGPSYGLAYVEIMTMFASALKRGTGIDLYQRPFWRGHARWRQLCLPHYAEWIGFGDHTERWQSNWSKNADLVELIALETGSPEFMDYVSAVRSELPNCGKTPPEREMPGVVSQKFLFTEKIDNIETGKNANLLHAFPDGGWAAIRTSPADPETDIALIFRSSPFGTVSHAHASNNDFALHVAGKVLTMPSGYYDGYGSNHHAHWVWHTKSHNCVTLSDAPQLLRSHDAVGGIIHPLEDEKIAYFCGVGDASYADRAQRCRRHVLFLKSHSCFLMIDEFVAKPGMVSALQWNLHSWSPFRVDEQQRMFQIEREGRSLTGHLLYHQNGFFSLTEGWDPPPMRGKKSTAQWWNQYHLRFTLNELLPKQNLAVVLSPAHARLPLASIQTLRCGTTEVCEIQDDLILINSGSGIQFGTYESTHLALLVLDNQIYQVTDSGLVSN